MLIFYICCVQTIRCSKKTYIMPKAGSCAVYTGHLYHYTYLSSCGLFYPHPLNAMCFPHSFPPTSVIIRMECSSGPWAWDLSKKTEVLEAAQILLWKIAFQASANGQFISCTMWLKWIIENKISSSYLSKNHAKSLHRSGFLLIYLWTHGLRMAD